MPRSMLRFALYLSQLATTGLAEPTAPENVLFQQTFNIEDVARPAEKVELVPKAGQHNIKLHKQRVPVASGTGVSYKSVYFGSIFLGGPSRQEFSMIFDTGSAHVIMPAKECKSKACKIHRQYDRRASKMAVDIDVDGTKVLPGQPRDQITVAFGTGEITGQFVYDRLCLGADGSVDQMDPDCVMVRVVAATEMSHEPFHTFAFDGILGLGLDELAMAPEFSLVGQFARQSRIGYPEFGVYLAGAEDMQSEICLGGHQPARHGPLAYAPVALPEHGHWQVRVLRIRVGDRVLDFCDDGTCRAAVDTGTSVLAVPVEVSDELYDALVEELQDPPVIADGDGTTGEEVDEENADCAGATGHLLEFDLEGGVTVSLGPGEYARATVAFDEEEEEEEGKEAGKKQEGEEAGKQQEVEEVGEKQEVAPEASSEEPDADEPKCQPVLLPLSLPEPLGPKLFIWGEPVLRKYYTVYDSKNLRIGFGVANHDSDSDGDGMAGAVLA